MSNDVVLSFHETLLRQSDVNLLDGPHWLNDNIISFYFEYLEKVQFATTKKVLFVSPEVTQCIKMVDSEEIGIFLNPVKRRESKFIFFALNDNNKPEYTGGSHWSLLVYSYPEETFFHLDSSTGSNKYVAKSFSRHVNTYFNNVGPPNFVCKPCAQQSNSYDCGVHVTINTELIAEHVRKHNSVSTCNTERKVSCSDKRKEIADIIRSLS